MAKKKRKKTTGKNSPNKKVKKNTAKKAGKSSAKKKRGGKKGKSKKVPIKIIKGSPKSKKKGSKKTAKQLKAKQQKSKSQQPQQPQPPQKKERSKIAKGIKHVFATKLQKPIIAGFSFGAFLVVFQFASLVASFGFSGSAIPGARVADIDVGSLTHNEVQAVITQKINDYLNTPINVRMGDQTQEFQPEELGIKFDPQKTIQEIKFIEIGNTNLAEVVMSMWENEQIPVVASIEIDKARHNIEQKFVFEERKFKNAHLAYEDNELIVIPGKTGDLINTKDLYNSIKESAEQLSLMPIIVVTETESPSVSAEALEEQKAVIKEILDKKIVLYYETFSWPLYLNDHLDWVSFDYKNTFNIGDFFSYELNVSENILAQAGSPEIIKKELWINIDQDKFSTFLNEEIALELELDPEDVSIYTDENKEIIIEGKGEHGRTINREYLTKGVILAANYNVNEVPIPIIERKMEIFISDDLQELGIETLIATGRSAFAGSTSNRIHNIGVGLSKFNGTLIAPGETFSFNTQLGPVEAYTGYLPELVIKADGTFPEYGGGLCQVSSTMYRAALFAGFPIVERAPHSYAVSYYSQIYGYGLDATIYPGVRDLKFINDTEGHILVQAYKEGLRAYFKFYGTDDGRSVEMEGPYLGGYRSPGPTVVVESPTLAPGQRKYVESAHTGFNASWIRHLTKDGETTEEPIYSVYRAIPARVLVGPGVPESSEPTVD